MCIRDSGICVKPYYEGKEDVELVFLSDALEGRSADPRAQRVDLRDIVSHGLGLRGFYNSLGYHAGNK